MATDFSRRQAEQHLDIGIRAMEKLRSMPFERLHSQKLCSAAETALQQVWRQFNVANGQHCPFIKGRGAIRRNLQAFDSAR